MHAFAASQNYLGSIYQHRVQAIAEYGVENCHRRRWTGRLRAVSIAPREENV